MDNILACPKGQGFLQGKFPCEAQETTLDELYSATVPTVLQKSKTSV